MAINATGSCRGPLNCLALISILVAAFITSLLFSTRPARADGDWSTETVGGSDDDYFYSVSLVLDHDGNPHLCWTSGPHYYDTIVHYAYKNEEGWHVSHVDNASTYDPACVVVNIDDEEMGIVYFGKKTAYSANHRALKLAKIVLQHFSGDPEDLDGFTADLSTIETPSWEEDADSYLSQPQPHLAAQSFLRGGVDIAFLNHPADPYSTSHSRETKLRHVFYDWDAGTWRKNDVFDFGDDTELDSLGIALYRSEAYPRIVFDYRSSSDHHKLYYKHADDDLAKPVQELWDIDGYSLNFPGAATYVRTPYESTDTAIVFALTNADLSTNQLAVLTPPISYENTDDLIYNRVSDDYLKQAWGEHYGIGRSQYEQVYISRVMDQNVYCTYTRRYGMTGSTYTPYQDYVGLSRVWEKTDASTSISVNTVYRNGARDIVRLAYIGSDGVRVATQEYVYDSDNDSVWDAQEEKDGTDVNDRGSVLPVLPTTVCSEWNGFLGGMYNIMEHVNMSSETLNVESTLYDINGQTQGTRSFSVLPGAQTDLLAHDMAGWTANTYGKVCSTITEGSAGDLDGRMVYYKPETNPSSSRAYQFAFAMPFLKGMPGPQYVPFNTFQPSLDPADWQNLVANWIQLTNLEATSQSGTLIFYGQDGAVLGSQYVTLDGSARRDFSGHQFGTNLVGLIEWVPDDEAAMFQLRNVRYLYDNAYGIDSFATAFQLEGTAGTGQSIGVPLDTNGASAILEVSNTLAEEVIVYLRIFDANGTAQNITENGETHPYLLFHLGGHSSKHVIADQILNGASGIAVLQGFADSAIIAVAMQYGRTATAGIRYMYGIQAKEPLGSILRSSYNTFLSQGCRLILTNPRGSAKSATIDMVRYDGTIKLSASPFTVPAFGRVDFDLCANDASDNYGVVTVTPQSGSSLVASVIRVGQNSDYLFPTPVRQ